MLYPFMFNVYSDDLWNKYEYTIVKIALFDMKPYDASWMDNPELPDHRVLVPDVDISKEEHKFNSEMEALNFIKEWWKKQD